MMKPIYTVVLDKLELLLEGTLSFPPANNFNQIVINENYFLKINTKQKHPSFKTCYDVYCNNKYFGHLFYNYISNYQFSTNAGVYLQIDNSIFYESNLSNKLQLFFECFSTLEFVSYQKMDIAIDGYDLISKHQKLMNSKTLKRKAKLKHISITYDENNKKPIAFLVGSKQSNKHIGIYNKQMELLKSKKNYINQFWKENNLVYHDVKTIDRIEGRFNSKELIAFSKDFKNLENSNYLISFFKLKFENYLSFVKPKNSTIKKEVINWSSFNYIKIQKEKTVQLESNDLFSRKVTIKTLFNEFLKSGDIHFLSSFSKIVIYSDLIDWSLYKIKCISLSLPPKRK